MDFPHYLFPSVSDMDASVVDLSAVREVAEVGAPGYILKSTSLNIYDLCDRLTDCSNGGQIVSIFVWFYLKFL